MIISQRLADTRRWAFYAIGAQMCAGNRVMHGAAPKPRAQLRVAGVAGRQAALVSAEHALRGGSECLRD